MSDKPFDPNGVGVANGNIFGFPFNEQDANIILIPVPWDATASYGKGASKGPEIILNASTQLDFYHPQLNNAWETKVFMTEISSEMKEINDQLCISSMEYISFLEQGGVLEHNSPYSIELQKINSTHDTLRENLKDRACKLRSQGKIVCVLGGEHSVPLGLIEALNEEGQEFGILQIDAHADLRDAYEGFTQSHASIMHNVLDRCDNMTKLVQVGIRDCSESEVIKCTTNPRVKTFFDWDIKRRQFEGENWKSIVDSIILELPQNVFISFDIDGLIPSLCPNTGTPVAGGFELEQINYLFFQLVDSGKKIIGFDLNEVAPGEDNDWDANVGARALWNLVCATEKSRKLNY
jgi:agmatinase